MFKAFVYGLILGVLLTGVGWFIGGRNNLADLRESIERTDSDLVRSEQLINQFEHDLGRYTDTFSVRVTEASGLRGSIGDLRDEFGGYVPEVGGIRGELEYISDGITSVEDSVLRVVILNRDITDVLYWYRRLGGKSETAE